MQLWRPHRFSPFTLVLVCLAFQLQLGCSKESFPKKYIETRKIFYDSIIAIEKADNMFKRGPNQGMVMRMPGQEKEYFDLIKTGIFLSGQVDDNFLDYLDPMLKELYRNNLILGKTEYYEGARTGSLFRQAEGSRLLEKWNSFWLENQKRVYDKAYPAT